MPHMAKQTIVQLIDDLDGSKAHETITYSIDGLTYEIDLNKKNAAKFRGLFKDYIAVSAKVPKSGKRPTKTVAGPSARELREWARSNGFEVPDRGRIPTEVREAWAQAK